MGGALASKHYLVVNDFLNPGYEIIKLDYERKVYEIFAFIPRLYTF